MAEDKLLTVRDVASFLDITEKNVIDLAEIGILPAYKVAGVYLRFKKTQIQEFKKDSKELLRKEGIDFTQRIKGGFTDKLSDFFYFYDFYLVSVVVIVILTFLIFRGF